MANSQETKMGWANCGTDSKGRPIGYAHDGECDFPGCGAKIDRGISYACGGMHGNDEDSCEGYFCEKHRSYGIVEDADGNELMSERPLCPSCCEAWESKRRGIPIEDIEDADAR